MNSATPLYFNSIKVRLERDNRYHKFYTLPLFQFHKGAIRTSGNFLPESARAYFNSIKVRLEHEFLTPPTKSFNYFNSIKVRLEQFASLFGGD